MISEEKKEYNKQYYQANRERLKEKQKQYYRDNAEKIKEYKKQYNKDNAEKINKYMKQYNKDNAERLKEQKKQYYQDNAERLKEYRKTPMGRALHLLNTYNYSDKKANRGRGDLTAQWIVERIFSQPCAHCGKEGWDVIGCNRLDNSLPHTMDNVEPCCFDCNRKIG